MRRKQESSLDEYLGDIELQHIVERSLQNAIQACIDIGARIISKRLFRRAESYHDIFDVLAQEKVISSDLADRMHEMVGLRNALVHEYRTIRHEEVYRHLQESPEVLEEFAREISRYLRTTEGGSE